MDLWRDYVEAGIGVEQSTACSTASDQFMNCFNEYMTHDLCKLHYHPRFHECQVYNLDTSVTKAHLFPKVMFDRDINLPTEFQGYRNKSKAEPCVSS